MEAKAKLTQPAKSHTSQEPSDENRRSFQCSSVSNGVWDYVGSNLVFTSHFHLEMHGNVKFCSNTMVIKLNSDQRIDIPYSIIQAITTEGLPQPAMTVTLTEAPQFFKSIDSDLASLMESLLGLPKRPKGPSRQRLPGLDSKHEMIAGSCLVYRIGLSHSTFREQITALKHAHGIPPTLRYHVEVRTSEEQYRVRMARLLQEFTSYPGLPFAVTFQVQKLAQNGYLSPSKVSALLLEIESLSRRSNASFCVNAVRRLSQQIPFPGPDTDSQEFELDVLISLLKDNEDRSKIGDLYLEEPAESENVAVIHRVTVTPAGIYLYGPEPESNNRVLRKYPNHHDYFIRVQFSDEDGSPVKFNPAVSNDPIYDRFRKILNEGISIGGRHFAFLGFSHSSLRAQSCWFMAPFSHDGHLLYDRMLIQGLGDFSNIRCPAKCAARIGQAFSETPTAITLAPGVVKEIPDVRRNGRVFSDGVGIVSLSVLEKIWEALPFGKSKNPLLLQIRYSGKCNTSFISSVS